MIEKDDPRLTAFALGELNQEEAAAIQVELDESVELQTAVDEIRLTAELLSLQFAEEPAISLTPQQREEILADAEALDARTRPAEKSHSRSRQLARWFVVAGIATILASLAYYSVDWSGDDPLGSLDEDRVAINGLKEPDKKVDTREKDLKAGDDLDADIEIRRKKPRSANSTAKQADETWGDYLDRLVIGGLIDESQKKKWDAEDPAAVRRVAELAKMQAEVRQKLVPLTRYRRELRTRQTPVTRQRELPRTRELVGVNGNVILEDYVAKIPVTEMVRETYAVEVPYIENVSQAYGFQVPVESVAPYFRSPSRDLHFGTPGELTGDELALPNLAWFDRSNSVDESENGVLLNSGEIGVVFDSQPPSSVLKVLASTDPLEDRLAFVPRRAPAFSNGLHVSSPQEEKPEASHLLARSHGQPWFRLPEESEQLGIHSVKGGIGRDFELVLGELFKKVDSATVGDLEAQFVDDQLVLMVDGEPKSSVDATRYFADFGVNAGESTWENLKEVESELNRHLKGEFSTSSFEQPWKPVQVKPNTTRLFVGDDQELEIQGLHVNVQVDGFRARVLLDCFYYNDHANSLEGDFKLRLPDDASVYYFAFGASAHEFSQDGELASNELMPVLGESLVSLDPESIEEERESAWQSVKVARMIPREKAEIALRPTPAPQFEFGRGAWNGAGVFSAGVSPLLPKKLHRIVIGYDISLVPDEDGMSYQLDLPAQLGQCSVNVNLNVASMSSDQLAVLPESGPESNGQGTSYRWNNRSLGDTRAIKLSVQSPVTILLHSHDDEKGDFWATRFKPELPIHEHASNDRAVFLLDTSLSSQPEKFHVWLELLRETLNRNRDTIKQFAVLMFNVEGYFWRGEYVENSAENVEHLIADCGSLALEGATDLNGALELLGQTNWVIGQGSKPDLFLLSDGAANWGETDLRLLSAQIKPEKFGSLFAYQTGLSGTAIGGLRFLANHSGGAVFSVTSEDEIAAASVAHRNRPWQIQSVKLEGGTDVLSAGRLRWVYPGQAITLVGRGDVAGDVELVLRQGEKEKIIFSKIEKRIESPLASRLYGQVSVQQLESLGSEFEDVATAYARYFRIPGQTCTLSLRDEELKSEGLKLAPEHDLLVVRSNEASSLVEQAVMERESELGDPKKRLINWVRRLEAVSSLSFKLPAALDLALEQIQVDTISGSVGFGIQSKVDFAERSERSMSRLSDDAFGNADELTRYEDHDGTSDELIREMSQLVEQNPGDLSLARDVAMKAMKWGQAEQAYGLLNRVIRVRPFEPTVYPLMGKCLAELGKPDLAIVYYEIAMEAKFPNRQNDFRRIVAVEYMRLLRQIKNGLVESSLTAYAQERLALLENSYDLVGNDLVITMMWNTSQSDLDLHVVEPSGEDCHFGYRKTMLGGQMTFDITNGFGPEMYTIADAPDGEYQVKVKNFEPDQRGSDASDKVYVTVYHNYGRDNEEVSSHEVDLRQSGDLEDVISFRIGSEYSQVSKK